jgi:hypothetical protein
MRWLIAWMAVLGSTVFFSGNLFAQQSLTVKGVTYADAALIKEYPLSVFISHASGKAFINKADLSAQDAQALGVSSIEQVPDSSTDATPSSASTSVFKSYQFPTPSAGAVSGASLQEVNAALEDLNKHITEQGAVLKGLIPRTTHITDLCELWRDYSCGFLDPGVEGMARARWDALAKDQMLFGSGYDLAKAQELSNQCSEQMNALIKEANLWIARRNELAELAESQAKASEAPRDGSSQMFRPVGSNMPSIEARRKNVKDGFVPLTRTELDRFLSGRPLSPMASTSEKNAWIMTEVMLGRRPAKDMPDEYRRVMEVNSRQAARGRAAANHPPSSRSVSGFDYQGNFYHGSTGPSGAFSGIRQGPSGAGIINDNFDQNGGFVWPH